jgi:hypothetical protein
MRAVLIVVLAALAGCASPTLPRSAEEGSGETGRCASFSRENMQTQSLLVAYRVHCVKDTPLGL